VVEVLDTMSHLAVIKFTINLSYSS